MKRMLCLIACVLFLFGCQSAQWLMCGDDGCASHMSSYKPEPVAANAYNDKLSDDKPRINVPKECGKNGKVFCEDRIGTCYAVHCPSISVYYADGNYLSQMESKCNNECASSKVCSCKTDSGEVLEWVLF